jgi:heparanase
MKLKSSPVLTGACLLSLAATASAAPPQPSAQSIAINAKVLPLVREIDDRFQSFQVGFSHLTGGETWRSYETMPEGGAAASGFAGVREARAPANLNNRRLVNLTRALAPMYIRYSGTTANSVYFHDSDAPPPAKAPDGYTVILTRAGWKGAVDFARAVDAKIVTSFANSSGVRDAAGRWTPRMAAPWLAFSRSIGGEIDAAELFNEPNAPEPPRIPKGHSPEEFAHSFADFRAFMNQAGRIKVAGPGAATLGVSGVPSIQGITNEHYASARPAAKFDIFSYHFYPAIAQRCAPETSPQGISVDKALTEEWLARPDAELLRQKAWRDRFAPGALLWLTEAGGAACGGLRWQQTFLDSFRYLDTQARLAKQGLDAIFTHALISGSNGIIDEKTFAPNASYWGAVLWRRLMGTKVLDAGPVRPGLHVYAHCLRGTRGGVALLALNLGSTPAALRLTSPAQLYALSAPELQSRTVLLGGRLLQVRSDDTLPPLYPERVSRPTVSLGPTTVNFIAMPQAGNPICT